MVRITPVNITEWEQARAALELAHESGHAHTEDLLKAL